MAAFSARDHAGLNAVFKFVRQLLDNRVHRAHLDPTSISGFLLYKESAKLLCDFYAISDIAQRNVSQPSEP